MQQPNPLIVLMTDFGLQDHYVGVMKGVIAGISPLARIIDLTHGIAPQNILQGSLQLGLSAPYFPDGTVFVAVVDPGVGTSRNAITLVTEKQVFVAPDNGLLSSVMNMHRIDACYAITNPSCMLAVQSTTFHGRDVFAPAAAHLSNGIDPATLGNSVNPEHCVRIPLPENSTPDGGLSWQGKILYADIYGNLITSFTDDLLRKKGKKATGIYVKNGNFLPLLRTYGEVAEGEPLVYRGSSGFLEIAVRNANASQSLGLKPGDNIELKLKPENTQT